MNAPRLFGLGGFSHSFHTYWKLPSIKLLSVIILASGLSPLTAAAQTGTPSYLFTTIAGSPGNAGTTDGTNRNARFYGVHAVTLDPAGNLFVADEQASVIRKVTPSGSDWIVTTIAGLAKTRGHVDGTNSEARFGAPAGLAADAAGNLYVADCVDHTIRKLAAVGTNWVVTTLAGSPGTSGSADGVGAAARFYGPDAVAADKEGAVYVADQGNQTIRRLQPSGTNWLVTTLVGSPGLWGTADGTNSAARFLNPRGLAVDDAGSVYVADDSHRIRKLQAIGPDWVVSTVAGQAGSPGSDDGTGANARFCFPFAVAVHHADSLFVADWGDETIRMVAPVGSNWLVSTIGGLPGSIGSADGYGSNARFWDPEGIAVDGAGNLYVSDYYNFTIREGSPSAPPPSNLYPVAHCKPVYTLADTNGLAAASVDDGSYDPDGDPVTISQSPPGPYPIGTNFVTLTVTDSKGASSSCSSPVLVLDPTPPVIGPPIGPSFDLIGKTGQIVIVQCSTDLIHWVPVTTNTISGDPPRFSDPNTTNTASQYYRLRLWP